jgi:hypothetical protein
MNPPTTPTAQTPERPTPDVDALFPKPGSIEWDEFIEGHPERHEEHLITAIKLARTLSRQRDELREALNDAIQEIEWLRGRVRAPSRTLERLKATAALHSNPTTPRP